MDVPFDTKKEKKVIQKDGENNLKHQLIQLISFPSRT